MERVPEKRNLNQLDLTGRFRIYPGGRFVSAGLRIFFDSDLEPGVHLKTDVSEEYVEAIVQGLEDGLALRFPGFWKEIGVSVLEVFEDELESSYMAFYRAARMLVDQAFSHCGHATPNNRVQTDRAKPGR